jgi:hypothetical protein
VVPASSNWLRLCSTHHDVRFGTDGDTKIYLVSRQDLVASGATRYAWTYGVLALPFKFYLSDKTFASGATIGPYVGRRILTQGGSITPAFSVSWTQANVTAGGSTTSVSGVAAALGFLFDLNSRSDSAFHSGVFMGVDYFGKAAGVTPEQNKKAWLAMQVGYDFSR